MPEKFPSPELNSDSLHDLQGLTFLREDEIAFTAIRQIQYLRANNQIKDANAIVDEWSI